MNVPAAESKGVEPKDMSGDQLVTRLRTSVYCMFLAGTIEATAEAQNQYNAACDEIKHRLRWMDGEITTL